MAEKNPRTKLFGLDRTVARLAVVVPASHPRLSERWLEVSMVKRPRWASFEAGKWMLVGGKVDDIDITKTVARPDLRRRLTEDEFVAVTRATALREAREEIGLLTRLDQLEELGVFDNGQVVTALFLLLLAERPSIHLAPRKAARGEVDGFEWQELGAAAEASQTFLDHGQLLTAVQDHLIGMGEEGDDDSSDGGYAPAPLTLVK